jgi:hypothetical protein
MLVVNPWRLLILFIVSGAATKFMAGKMTPAELFRVRSLRLLPPLLFVTAVIVPPMGFVAARQWLHYRGDFLGYLGHYFSVTCHGGNCTIHLGYGHLWFVAYLLIYTIGVIGLLAFAPGALGVLQRRLERVLSGWGLIVWPVAYLALARFALEARFPQSYDVIHDWYAHAIYLGGFLLGFALAKSEDFWAAAERIRWPALVGALSAYVVLIATAIVVLGADFNWASKVAAVRGNGADRTPLLVFAATLYGLDQWLWIAAAFGFAHRHLRRSDGPVRRYLTDAIFPFYIIHELTIIVGGYYLAQLGLSLSVEPVILVAATALSCIVTYEIVRRCSWLRPLFGLKAQAGRRKAAGPHLQQPARVLLMRSAQYVELDDVS